MKAQLISSMLGAKGSQNQNGKNPFEVRHVDNEWQRFEEISPFDTWYSNSGEFTVITLDEKYRHKLLWCLTQWLLSHDIKFDTCITGVGEGISIMSVAYLSECFDDRQI